MASVALHTDHYELTMVAAALAEGTAHRRTAFECFARRLPGDAAFGIVAGIDAALDALEEFAFTPQELAYLEAQGVIDEGTRSYLEGWHFTGDVDGLPEGELWYPDEPVLTVRAPFADAVLLETVVLSAIGPVSSVASAAARMRQAAGDRTLIEMGSRRVHHAFAVEAARAAVVGGFDATSNLAAGHRHGIPTTGTAAHAWTLLHPGENGEEVAFRAQMEALGTDTTLLVDTFDTREGTRRAVAAARSLGVEGPGAIRIDSGDLDAEVRWARQQLDDLGAHRTRIVVSGDLGTDELEALRTAPVDGYGVGTKVVGAPSAGFVYKLAEVDGVGVAKASGTPGKATIPGHKHVVRHHRRDGSLAASEIRAVDAPHPDPAGGAEAAVVVTEAFLRGGRRIRPSDPVGRTRAAVERSRRSRASVRGDVELVSPVTRERPAP